MDKETRQEIVKEISREFKKSWRDTDSGSANWRMTESLRKRIEADSESKVFNGQFADGISDLIKQAEKNIKTYRIALFISGALLLFTLPGYALPVDFPYIGNLARDNLNPSGIVEILLATFLISISIVATCGSEISLYKSLLRTYISCRHGDNARDLLMLRWGVNDISFYLYSDEYDGLVRTHEPNVFLRAVGWLNAIVLLMYIIAAFFIILFATITIFLNPAFGWLSYLLVSALNIYSLNILLLSLRGNAGGVFSKRESAEKK